MGSGINFPAAAFLVLVVIATWAAGKASASTYVVGDSAGWTVPSGGAATYAAFSAQHTFQVGDLLLFNFKTGQSDLAIVSKENYDGCVATAPISLVKNGPATVNLTSIGEAYFISTLNNACSQGQKLAVNVTAASTASPVPTVSPPMPAPKASPAAPPTSMSPPPMSPTPAPGTAPTMSPPAPAPAPGSGGPSMAPSPGSPGGMPSGPALAPGSPGGAPAPAPGSPGGAPAPAPGSPGGAPGDMTPPPSAAPAAPTATAALLLIASVVIASFF